MSLFLSAKVSIVRFMLNYNDYMERRTGPAPSTPSFTKQIPSTSARGHTLLEFFMPSGYDAESKSAQAYPVVIVLHGGGYSSGRPSMDYRFIDTLLALPIKPVVVAVDYALAPEYAFPAGILDTAAAITWLSKEGAVTHNLDPARMVISGFSAGAGFSLVTPMYLKEHAEKDSLSGLAKPLRGVIAMYPQIDARLDRLPGTSALGTFLYSVWDECYSSRSPRESAFVSPAAADDALLTEGLPTKIGLYPAGLDPYVKPTEAFRQRLEALGKQVSGFIEPDEIHAWDKYPIKPESPRWQKRQDWFSKIATDIESMLKD